MALPSLHLLPLHALHMNMKKYSEYETVRFKFLPLFSYTGIVYSLSLFSFPLDKKPACDVDLIQRTNSVDTSVFGYRVMSR